MNLSPAKREVLEALLLHDKPVKATQLAKEMQKEFPAIQMHLIGLAKMGAADSPQKGQYLISANGKKALDLPEPTKEKALAILAATPHEKAFYFYAGIGKPLNISAHNLREFCTKVNNVKLDSVEFHLSRGDFEAWFSSLGDVELAKKIALLNVKKMRAEEMTVKLHELVEDRCLQLAKIAGHSAHSP